MSEAEPIGEVTKTPRDLAAVRAELAERRARTALVNGTFEAAFKRLQSGDQVRRADIRCDCGKQLARVYATAEGALFTSKIEWLASDQLTLTPWARDAHLAATDPALPGDALSEWLEQLDGWSDGLPATGPRWLNSATDVYVRDVLTLPTGPSGWMPGLWVRCRRHPKAAYAVDRDDMLAATRQ